MTTVSLPQSPLELSIEERIRAIRERTTRGLLTFNTGMVHHLGCDVWAVPSSRGGWWKPDLVEETCGCEDYEHFGSKHGIACRHVYAAAIARARATRRRQSFIAAWCAGETEERG